MSTQGDPFASDNAMRKVAKRCGLRIHKDRDTPYMRGSWHVTHTITREKLLRGSRADVAAFIAAYEPGEERLNILKAISVVRAIAPIIDWPDARTDDSVDAEDWGALESIQKRLADFEPSPTFVHPEPPPEPSAAETILGFSIGVAKGWRDVRRDIWTVYVDDLAPLKAIEDAGERRRAFAEAGRLRFYLDYVLEHRATWSEIDAEQKAIAREADIIAGLRTDAGRQNENPALTAKRHDEAAKREAKLAERKAELDKRLGIREERRYWRPHINRAHEKIKSLQDEIVAGHYTDELTVIEKELGELTKLIARTKLLALDGDLRERTRKVRAASRDKHKIEATEEEAS